MAERNPTTTMGRERPILFSGPMVRAILAATKTQTRRLVADVPAWPVDCWVSDASGSGKWMPWGPAPTGGTRSGPWRPCPYGVPGDRLWVRETFRMGYGSGMAHFRADEDECAGGPWTPSIYMPRTVSRLTLEVTDVRVQRLHDISEEDAKAEGVEPYSAADPGHAYGAAFSGLWDVINAKRAPWDSNPWVWCVSFVRSGSPLQKEPVMP